MLPMALSPRVRRTFQCRLGEGLNRRVHAMSNTTQPVRSDGRDQVVFAIALIGIGAIGLISQVWRPNADLGGWVVLVIGLAFLAGFGYTRRYGYVVPGGIMTGLGAGILASQLIRWSTNEGEG